MSNGKTPDVVHDALLDIERSWVKSLKDSGELVKEPYSDLIDEIEEMAAEYGNHEEDPQDLYDDLEKIVELIKDFKERN